MSRARPLIAVTMGDPCGIGPEVLRAALNKPKVRRALEPVVFADASLVRRLPGVEVVTVSALSARDLRPGRPNLRSGRAQLAYVDAAIAAAQQGGRVQALCTAPVSKEWISRAGIPFMGHTERLAAAFEAQVLMVMSGPRLRVALATNHLPLSQVPQALSQSKLLSQLLLLSRGLAPRLGRAPRIAVCGLNPHAGEGGLLGKEELRVIAPAVKAARRKGVDCQGPFPADGLLARAAKPGFDFDAVLAMFHDQGLVAAKVLDFDRTVNVTLGLPVPRTSPDHGVAYDIAGKGVANPTPMIEALLEAAMLASHPSLARRE